ncbi:MAG: hypothetical protein EGQ00_13650 [Parabacteroides johnsonii]|nr:hypothetical protein [Parabacteroides johnsonii]
MLVFIALQVDNERIFGIFIHIRRIKCIDKFFVCLFQVFELDVFVLHCFVSSRQDIQAVTSLDSFNETYTCVSLFVIQIRQSEFIIFCISIFSNRISKAYEIFTSPECRYCHMSVDTLRSIGCHFVSFAVDMNFVISTIFSHLTRIIAVGNRNQVLRFDIS